MSGEKQIEKIDVQAARERLFRAALDLFAERGYASTTVRDIVAAAGVTKPVLYYYFKNKEGLFLELVNGPVARFFNILENALKEDGSAQERLARLFDRLLVLYIEEIKVARLLYSIYYGPPQGAPFLDLEGYHMKMREAIREIVREGIGSGEFAKSDLDTATWVLLGALNLAQEEQLCRRPPQIHREDMPRILDTILRGLAAGKNKPKKKGNSI